MNEAFEAAVDLVIFHEGSVVTDHPDDPGGQTRYGISKRAYPNEDIPNLTIDRAKTIYYNDYWLPLQAWELPPAVATVLFDMAVNMGKTGAVRCLQRALGVIDDGWVGPVTRHAIQAADPAKLAEELTAQRIMRYTELAEWTVFGLGWTRRSIRTLLAVTTSA